MSNLSLYKNVDATTLGSDWVTVGKQYNAVVFNRPRADAPLRPKGPHNTLVDEVLQSALNVLKPGGQMRFSASGGGPAAWHLQTLVKPGTWPPGYSDANGGPVKWHGGGDHYLYLNDPLFGVSYQPMTNEGKPLKTDWNDVHWYIFTR